MQFLVHKDSPSPWSQKHQVPRAPESGHRVPGSSRPLPGRGSYLTTYYGDFQTRVTVPQHRDSQVAVTAQESPPPRSLPAHGNTLKPTGAEKDFLPPKPGRRGPRSTGKGVSQEGVLGRKGPQVWEALSQHPQSGILVPAPAPPLSAFCPPLSPLAIKT